MQVEIIIDGKSVILPSRKKAIRYLKNLKNPIKKIQKSKISLSKGNNNVKDLLNNLIESGYICTYEGKTGYTMELQKS